MKYMKLDQKGSAMAEYIWVDANGGVRSKSKVCIFLFFFTLLFAQTHIPYPLTEIAWVFITRLILVTNQILRRILLGP